MILNKINVVIPLYNSQPDINELHSLIQCFKILNKYDFTFICSHSFICDNFKEEIRKYNINLKIERFDDKFFASISGYNTLLIS